MIRTEPLRYAAVGLACAALSNAVIIALVSVGVHYAFACLVAFVVVVIVGFVLHAVFTFGVSTSSGGFVSYTSAMAANLPLHILCVAILGDGLGLPIVVASPLSTTILFAWNYIAVRFCFAPSAGRLAGKSP